MEQNDKPFRLQITDADDSETQILKLMEAIVKDPKGISGYYRWIHNIYIREKNYEKAFEFINKAIETATEDSDRAENFGFLSMWYSWQGMELESIPALIKSAEYDPTSKERWLSLGCAYLELKDYKNAMEAFGKLLKLPKDDDDELNDWEEMYYESMAGIYSEGEDYTKANKLYNKLLKDAETDEAKARILALISNMYDLAEDNANAVANMKKAMKLMPDNYGYIVRLARLYSKGKQLDNALLTYKNILNLNNTGSVDKHMFERIYNTRVGEMYFEMNKFDEAIESYKKNLKLYLSADESYPSLEQICAIHYQQRQYKEAVPYLKKIIKLWPKKYPRAYTSMAIYYYKILGDTENALNYLSIGAQANYMHDDFELGNDQQVAASIYALKGLIYDKEYDNKEEAINYYEKALKCEPDKAMEAEICDGLFNIYVATGDEEKAEEYREKRSPHKLLLDMFNGNWKMPPKKTLHERLRNSKNTKEEIEKLPYHYSNFPKAYLERSKYNDKLHEDFETDLLTNPKYKEFYSKHEPFYLKGFIHDYVNHKSSLVSWHNWYLDADYGYNQIMLHDATYKQLDFILQKKLFNMQLLWRAEQITIPEIKTTSDFIVWEHKIFECPFIEAITSKEIEVMKEFILKDDFEKDNYRSLMQMQDYNSIIYSEEEGQYENMPAWYAEYDKKMNTGALLLLPNTRGEKEQKYFDLYVSWKQTQPPDIHPPQVPYVKGLDLIFGNEESYTAFMEMFEDDYLCNLHQNWTTQHEYKDKTFQEDEVATAMETLKNAEEPPIMEGGLPWHQAIIKCARLYENRILAANMDEMYADYKMKRELNIPHIEKESGSIDTYGKMAEERIVRILKGRELAGEPKDLNY